MDIDLYDVTVFLTGFISGGALTAVAMIAVTRAAVERIIHEMTRKGFFFYKGVAYRVRPHNGGPHDG